MHSTRTDAERLEQELRAGFETSRVVRSGDLDLAQAASGPAEIVAIACAGADIAG